MNLYRIAFINQGKVYEIYAKNLRQGELYGFVEVEGLVFNQSATLLVDPGEERLKSEFAEVRRTFIPMHAVIRIDEVEKQGQSRILDYDKDSKITPFPGTLYPPDRKKDV